MQNLHLCRKPAGEATLLGSPAYQTGRSPVESPKPASNGARSSNYRKDRGMRIETSRKDPERLHQLKMHGPVLSLREMAQPQGQAAAAGRKHFCRRVRANRAQFALWPPSQKFPSGPIPKPWLRQKVILPVATDLLFFVPEIAQAIHQGFVSR
ncbi:hypothetical protein DTO271G3_6077 [Paecilomyces variotii]|nr:hypothetical protein DTO271G3_6077 [Paecilomyces variotii]